VEQAIIFTWPVLLRLREKQMTQNDHLFHSDGTLHSYSFSAVFRCLSGNSHLSSLFSEGVVLRVWYFLKGAERAEAADIRPLSPPWWTTKVTSPNKRRRPSALELCGENDFPTSYLPGTPTQPRVIMSPRVS